MLNDWSARDVQMPEMGSGFGPQKAKHFVTTLSETAVSADEVLPRISELTASVIINGEVVARPESSTMRYRLGEMLAHCSRGEQLYPGEMFGTGTWPTGSGLETGNWVGRGDHLELSIDGIGSLSHSIV